MDQGGGGNERVSSASAGLDPAMSPQFARCLGDFVVDVTTAPPSASLGRRRAVQVVRPSAAFRPGVQFTCGQGRYVQPSRVLQKSGTQLWLPFRWPSKCRCPGGAVGPVPGFPGSAAGHLLDEPIHALQGRRTSRLPNAGWPLRATTAVARSRRPADPRAGYGTFHLDRLSVDDPSHCHWITAHRTSPDRCLTPAHPHGRKELLRWPAGQSPGSRRRLPRVLPPLLYQSPFGRHSRPYG